MRPIKPWHLVAAWLLGLLTFAPLPAVSLPGLPDFGWLVGGSGLWQCPSSQPVAVAVAADLSIAGDQAIGKTNPGVIPAIQTAAGPTNYYLIDVKTATSEPDDVDWKKAAWRTMHDKPGTWAAAGPRGGFGVKTLPVKADDATSQLKRLMK